MYLYKIRCFYEKSGVARFISNRNLQKLIERGLRRFGAPLKFTEGFSPHPKMSFGPPLPVNVSGTNECFDFYVTEKLDSNIFIETINNFLPEGICIKEAFLIPDGSVPMKHSDIFALYEIIHDGVENDILRGWGEIVESGSTKTIIRVKVNNFSHKAMISMFLEGRIKDIKREITLQKH